MKKNRPRAGLTRVALAQEIHVTLEQRPAETPAGVVWEVTVSGRDLGEPPPDHLGNAAAHATVDLVENHRRNGAGSAPSNR